MAVQSIILLLIVLIPLGILGYLFSPYKRQMCCRNCGNIERSHEDGGENCSICHYTFSYKDRATEVQLMLKYMMQAGIIKRLDVNDKDEK